MIFVDGMGAAVGSDDYWWQLMIINGKQFQLMTIVDGMEAAVSGGDSDDYWWKLMIINSKQFQLMTIADGMGTGGGDSDYYIHIDDN